MSRSSNVWLKGWKLQYGVKQYHWHGKAGSAPIAAAERPMQEVRRIVSNKELHNIFNADEAGLYHRMQPDCGITTERMAGRKKDKTYLTVRVTANGDSSESILEVEDVVEEEPGAGEQGGEPEKLAAIQRQVSVSYDFLQDHNWTTRNVMAISNFLNPVEEQIEDLLEDIEGHIIATYQEAPAGESPSQAVGAPQIPPVVSLTKVIAGLEEPPLSDPQHDTAYRNPKISHFIRAIQVKAQEERLSAANKLQQS
ncbi:hypothetical protein BZA77DRAFT_360152 [Pyronema omphalodes]|nr:hypothetical protein BZA77DRAFT_360152 [Pyronema omphalodes]